MINSRQGLSRNKISNFSEVSSRINFRIRYNLVPTVLFKWTTPTASDPNRGDTLRLVLAFGPCKAQLTLQGKITLDMSILPLFEGYFRRTSKITLQSQNNPQGHFTTAVVLYYPYQCAAIFPRKAASSNPSPLRNTVATTIYERRSDLLSVVFKHGEVHWDTSVPRGTLERHAKIGAFNPRSAHEYPAPALTAHAPQAWKKKGRQYICADRY